MKSFSSQLIKLIIMVSNQILIIHITNTEYIVVFEAFKLFRSLFYVLILVSMAFDPKNQLKEHKRLIFNVIYINFHFKNLIFNVIVM